MAMAMEARLVFVCATLLGIMMSAIPQIVMTEILLPSLVKRVSTVPAGEMVASTITVMVHRRKNGQQWLVLALC